MLSSVQSCIGLCHFKSSGSPMHCIVAILLSATWLIYILLAKSEDKQHAFIYLNTVGKDNNEYHIKSFISIIYF